MRGEEIRSSVDSKVVSDAFLVAFQERHHDGGVVDASGIHIGQTFTTMQSAGDLPGTVTVYPPPVSIPVSSVATSHGSVPSALPVPHSSGSAAHGSRRSQFDVLNPLHVHHQP